jgi:MFS family permease
MTTTTPTPSPRVPAGSPGGDTQKPSAPRSPNAILFVILAAQLMAVIDLTIVNVAAPTIRIDLHASGSALQLVIAGYVITYAMTLITGARLGDRYGHGRLLRLGLALFALSSLLCGLAPSSTTLIVFRFVQGIGAGLMMPQVMSLIQRTFQGEARLRALGLYSAVIALGAMVGQVAGGALVSADILGSGWRPIFLLNVPLGLALHVLAGRWLPIDRGESGRRLDPIGVLTLSGGVLAIVLPLVLGHEQDWPLWGWISLGVGAALLAVFALVERRVARRDGSPLISGRLMHTPGFVTGAATVLLTMLAFSGFLFTLTLNLQGALRDSAFVAGLLFVPSSTGTTITSLNWRRLPVAWHRIVVPLGLLGSAVTYLLLAPIEGGGQRNTGLLVADLFFLGLFFGVAYSPIISLTLANVPIADAADASGVLITMVQLGQVLGVATLGTLYLTVLPHHPAGHAAAIAFMATAGCALVAAASGAAMARCRS